MARVLRGRGGTVARRLIPAAARLPHEYGLPSPFDGIYAGETRQQQHVKDAYLRWTYLGRQQMTLGIEPSLSVEWVHYSAPADSAIAKPKDDVVWRATFYWAW